MIKYLFLQPNNMNDYDMKEEKGAVDEKKALTLKTLTKSSVWDVQENDIFRMFEAAEKEADLKENFRHYLDIIRSAFEMEEVKIDKPEVIKKYEARGFKIANIKLDENTHMKLAIKKRPIMRVTDLTYENIRHISAATSEVAGTRYRKAFRTLLKAASTSAPPPFPRTVCTSPAACMRRR